MSLQTSTSSTPELSLTSDASNQTTTLAVPPGYQIKLCDFDFREPKARKVDEKNPRQPAPAMSSNYVRFTLEWSVKLANGHFHSWRCRGCIFTRSRRGELSWHPPMTKHSSLGTAYQPHELSRDLYQDVLEYIVGHKKDWVDWIGQQVPDAGRTAQENVMVQGVAE